MKPGKRKDRLPPFVALGRGMLKTIEWREGLTASEKVLYIHLKAKFVGINNGELCLHYSELKGLMAKGTACTAFKGLEEKGWIEKTRQGGLYRFTNLFRLTGKYDEALVNNNR